MVIFIDLWVMVGLRDGTPPQVPVPTQPLVENQQVNGNENIQIRNIQPPVDQRQEGVRFMSHPLVTFFVSMFYPPNELVVN